MLRRFFVCLAISFSFGGFSFYAVVVVPIGGSVLDTTLQGFVTRQVAQAINAATVLTSILLLWEICADWRVRSGWLNRALSVSVAAQVVTCAVLIAVHPTLDALLDIDNMSVDEPARFYGRHQVYLWVSTVQWLSSLAVLWFLIVSWQSVCDRVPTDGQVLTP